MSMKDDFYKLENEEWIKVEFKDIKNYDTIVKKSREGVYYSVLQEPKFDEELDDFVIIVNIIEKVEVEFDWSL
jgi:hypothetical protein